MKGATSPPGPPSPPRCDYCDRGCALRDRLSAIAKRDLADRTLTPAEAEQLVRALDALEEIGLPAHVPNGFDLLDWWRHTACKRGEIARASLGVTAEELIAKKWHKHVETTR